MRNGRVSDLHENYPLTQIFGHGILSEVGPKQVTCLLGGKEKGPR